MSASDELKEQIARHYDYYYNIKEAPSDWKRLSKNKSNHLTLRVFQHKTLGLKVKAISESDDDHACLIEDDVWLFAICNYDNGLVYSFAPSNLWQHKKMIPDGHIGYALEITHGLVNPDEIMENCFSTEDDYQTTKTKLEALGFVHSVSLEADLQKNHFDP